MPAQFSYPITFLPSDNLEKTRDFYENIMRLPVASDQGACILFRVGKHGYLAFCAGLSENIKNPGSVVLNFIVKSQQEVDEWDQYLVAKGVQVKRPPEYRTAFKIYNGLYIDPMGYTIEIQSFDEEARPIGADYFED